MSYLAYKPQVRQEGFHLPHQNAQPPSPGSNGYDATSMFMLPDAFRKFPQAGAPGSLDFSDELAQLMAGPNAQPPTPGGSIHGHGHGHGSLGHSGGMGMGMNISGSADMGMNGGMGPLGFDGRPTSLDDPYRHTRNIFDISAPIPASNHAGYAGPSTSQLPTPSSSAPVQSHYPSAFALQPHRPPTQDHGLLTPASSLSSNAGGLGGAADFNKPPMFNSTLPALNSSMRFEPPAPPGDQPGGPQHAPSAFALPPDFRQRHTPSPGTGLPSVPPGVSRSRSRSRAPSTGPGPTRTQSTTRATRAKRNSISSSSPPPRPHPSAIHIPTAAGTGIGLRGASRDAVHSPLAMSANSWFAPEFGLPTPDSVSGHGAFSLGARDTSLGPSVDGRDASPGGTALTDVAAKQAAIASEKRRRRRESHNAVERRRRDNINEKIGELATLIPECMLDPNGRLSLSDVPQSTN
jgi:hypothetical protein